MSNWLGAAALGASALQALLMGLIGYPIAVSRRRGLEKFHRSGFAWWLVTLALLLAMALATAPTVLGARRPSSADISLLSIAVIGVAGCVIALAVEIVGNLIARRTSRPGRGSERYDEALPDWVRLPYLELLLLSTLAILEEMTYRCLGLGWLIHDLGIRGDVSVLIAALAFGIAHWYYGIRQIALKAILGMVFGAVALRSGWLAAALSHLLLNSSLIALNQRSRGQTR